VSAKLQNDQKKLDRLLSGFTATRLKTPKISFLYRVSLLAVAFGMILLPIVYLGLTVYLGYLALSMMFHPPAVWEPWDMIKYGLIVVSGPIAFFFMIKPLFAKPVVSKSAMTLNPEDEPLLDAFVKKVAEVVGASVPEKVEVDCSVNASASYIGGIKGVYHNRLKLVIGLPLVAGLSLRSLAGVLAHEFGHFSQAAGMRMTYVIRRVNNWFYRVVYERDMWDVKLYDALDDDKPVKALVAYVALFIVMINRGILWFLMVLGNGISCFALRQMEYDADTYEIQLAGSDVFDRTTRRIGVLHAGSTQALRLIEENWHEQRLAEDFATLTRTQADSLSKKVLDAIEESIQESKTSAFSTHPTDLERIREAEKAGERGIFHIEEPASVLFQSFHRLSRRATANFYREDLGLDFGDGSLVPNKIVYREGRARKNEAAACERYFCGRLTVLWPMWVTPAELEEFRKDRVFTREDLAEAIDGMNVEIESCGSAFDKFEAADDQYIMAIQARELMMAGYRVDPERFGLKRGDLGEAVTVRDNAQIERNQALVKLTGFNRAAKLRLMTGLALLKQRELENGCIQNGSGFMAKECDRFLEVLGVFGEIRETLLHLRELWMGQSALMNTLSPDGASETVIERLQANCAEFGPLHKELRNQLSAIFPFKHAKGAISLKEYVEHSIDSNADICLRTFAISEKMVERMFSLYFRVVGRLVILAETVEMGEWMDELEI
jgi:Zn-dependent protease with chaperone function